MTGLAGKGLQVLFIENTGVRSPRLSDLSRVMHRIKCSTGQIIQDIPPGVKIFSPLAVPLPYNSIAIRYNQSYISKHIKKFLHANNLQPSEVIFWSCLSTPVALSLMKRCAWGATVYDVVSDPKYIEPRLGPSEQIMLKLTDYTFFASATLLDQYHSATKNPLLFEDGFNLELRNSTALITEIEQLPQPRLLYIGGINKKLQVEAITKLAQHFKGGSIILVGPLSDGVEIPTSKNIHIYPPCNSYNDLAGFLRAADIGLIPYVQDRYAGAMHPAKINEYLVFGLPIVATSTPELERLANLWGDGFFYLYNDPLEVLKATEKALICDNEASRIKRKSWALSNDWDGRISRLMEILEQKI
ncbi:putative teichuronic acid biosynthesis glycosyltransferase TuaH [Pelotomaculum schinkii]|uniref:Putative teichuronic acid biosynthesis glycosyltransferase TuaH n=2 Tax=Pelotomaculum schinkii TaxID=78350 RepID=A0A4Y7R6Y5_9FIRM|nr:putative teichuronic acid biosynthesis glycosyltransferase TuaH [Pelotomaculum schinkii]